MFPNTSKHNEKGFAILADEENIKEFYTFLSKEFADIKFSGEAIDKTKFKFKNIEELFNYPNHKERKLVQIDISCHQGLNDVDARLSISISNSFSILSKSVRYQLYYNSMDWGFRFDDELNKHLRIFRPWYDIITRINLIFGIPLLLASFVMIINFFDVSLKLFGYEGYINYSKESSEPHNPLFYINLYVLLGLFLLLVGYILELGKRFLFPKMFIALGKQKKEYELRKNARNVIFVIIILGILINLFSTWLYNL